MWRLHDAARDAAVCTEAEAVDLLLGLLEHPRPLVRRGAAIGLAPWRNLHGRATDAMKARLAIETSPGVRLVIATERSSLEDAADLRRHLVEWHDAAEWRAIESYQTLTDLEWYDGPRSGFAILGNGVLCHWSEVDRDEMLLCSTSQELAESYLTSGSPTIRALMLRAKTVYLVRMRPEDWCPLSYKRVPEALEEWLPSA